MRANEFVIEAPLPPDWELPKTFAGRVKYAVERSKKVGTGSSRVVFNIEYEGRATALKIAKNKKGLAQNEYEARFLSDGYLGASSIVIPIIDYDKEHDQPLWVQTEMASKVTPSIFEKHFSDLDPDDVMEIVDHFVGRSFNKTNSELYSKLAEENENISALVDLVGSSDLHPGDLTRVANWGIYQGSIVIIDIGGSSEIISSMY